MLCSSSGIRHLMFCFLFLVTGLSLRAQIVILRPDTVDLVPEIPDTVDLLANDYIPAGDSVKVYFPGCKGIYGWPTVKGIEFTANPWGNAWGLPSQCSGHYTVYDYTLDSAFNANIVFRVRDNSYDSLCLNNINARFNACGNHFWSAYRDQSQFEVPKFSGKNSIYASAFWIGGKDSDSLLHIAAEKYREGPTYAASWTKADFRAGPVMDSSYYNEYQDTLWNYVWNLKKSDIEYHKAHFHDPGYVPIRDILTWPGNGMVFMGESARLAPFFDVNNDGIYTPFAGDYPLIKGDQCLFFIFSDDKEYHTESWGEKMKTEVLGMAYVFDIPQDSAFSNTVFLNYKIYNRSGNTYFNTFTGIFTDIDVGFYEDDLAGCDVERSTIFGYNGKPVDGTGQPAEYGEHPPAQGVVFLGGPRLDPDGLDNPRFDNSGNQLCNESVNGLNFGDGIADNERYGLRKFMTMWNPWLPSPGPPGPTVDTSRSYYWHMQGIWLDSTRIMYGGNGHPGTGAYGPACDFMFPGESDSLNWGVGCQLPNGPINWTEQTVHNDPHDLWTIGSMGPFTFRPGEMQEVDVAYVFARDYAGSDTLYPSVGKLMTYVDEIRNVFITNKLPDGSTFNGADEIKAGETKGFTLYPNPARSTITLRSEKEFDQGTTLTIRNISGVTVRSVIVTGGTHSMTLDVSSLQAGIYLVTVQERNRIETMKVSIIR
jgi:hypothetical protein